MFDNEWPIDPQLKDERFYSPVVFVTLTNGIWQDLGYPPKRNEDQGVPLKEPRSSERQNAHVLYSTMVNGPLLPLVEGLILAHHESVDPRGQRKSHLTNESRRHESAPATIHKTKRTIPGRTAKSIPNRLWLM